MGGGRLFVRYSLRLCAFFTIYLSFSFSHLLSIAHSSFFNLLSGSFNFLAVFTFTLTPVLLFTCYMQHNSWKLFVPGSLVRFVFRGPLTKVWHPHAFPKSYLTNQKRSITCNRIGLAPPLQSQRWNKGFFPYPTCSKLKHKSSTFRKKVKVG